MPRNVIKLYYVFLMVLLRLYQFLQWLWQLSCSHQPARASSQPSASQQPASSQPAASRQPRVCRGCAADVAFLHLWGSSSSSSSATGSSPVQPPDVKSNNYSWDILEFPIKCWPWKHHWKMWKVMIISGTSLKFQSDLDRGGCEK